MDSVRVVMGSNDVLVKRITNGDIFHLQDPRFMSSPAAVRLPAVDVLVL